MKKVLRVLLLIIAAFLLLFMLLATMNMISKGELNIKALFYGNWFLIALMGLCIVGFCALGEKPKKK